MYVTHPPPSLPFPTFSEQRPNVHVHVHVYMYVFETLNISYFLQQIIAKTLYYYISIHYNQGFTYGISDSTIFGC